MALPRIASWWRLAVLSLLAEAGEVEPLVCLVDDAQWLDRASMQALAFVARRLLAERVAMLFSVRVPNDVNELTGLPELVVGGLADEDARRLLARLCRGGWTNTSAIRSSPRPAAILSRCWSCRAG